VRVIARDLGHVLGEDPWNVRHVQTRVRRSTAVVAVLAGSLATLLALSDSSTASPRWSQAIVVDANATGRAGAPAVALGPDGSGVIVWLFEEPLSCKGAECVFRLKASTRQSRSQEWSAPVTLATLARSSASRPEVAIDGSGEATVAYSEGSSPLSRSIRAVTWQPSSGWGDPVTVSTDPTAWSPRIEVNRRGDAVVTWAIVPTQLQSAYRSSETNEWGAPTTFATYGAGGDVALDDRGNAIATWVSDVEKETLASFRPVASGLWRKPVVLNHTLGGAHVEFDEAGNALAVWSENDTTQTRAVAAYRPFGRTWGAPETIARRSGVVGFVVGRAGALVLLARYPSGRLASMQRANASGRWRPSGEITHSDRWSQWALAGDAAGDAVVVWSEFVGGETVYDGGNEVIKAAIHPAGSSKWRASLNVIPDSVIDATDVDMDAAGNALAAWSGRGWGWLIARSEMEGDGPLLENVHAPDGRAGVAIDFRATVTPWGAPLRGDPVWSFGDGRKARGGRVSHVYRRRGRYVVRVSQTDVGGKTTTATRVVAVGSRKT
jgi:PKD domain